MNSRPDCKDGGKPGFTIVELFLVLAIAALILGISIPITVDFYRRQLVADTAYALNVTFRRARSYATAQRNDSAFGVKILPGEFVLFQGPSYASRTASEDESLSYSSTLTVTGSSTEFVFSKLYATSSASGTVSVVGEADYTVQLFVTSSGKAELK